MPAETAERSRRLYAILSSLLQHKPKMLLRQVPNRNGYETWRQLVNIYAPRSKVRGLALLNAIMSFPPFVKSKTTREQVDGLDRLAQEYERVSGVAVNPDILLGTLLRVLPAHLRNHIQLQMKSDTSYEQVKQFILTYEVTTSNWSASKVQQSLGIGPSGDHSASDPVPMDVDRVAKGKPKGGKGDGRGKGGKDKGGKGGKPNGGKPNPGGGGGKSQNANQPKGGKGKGGKAQKETRKCHHCHKVGHLAKDCWLLHGKGKGKGVHQVAEVNPSSAASEAPTITTSGGAASTSGTVRRVQVFDLSAPADWFIGGHVRAVTCAMQSARNPKAVQSPAGPSGQVAIGQACSSDILSPEFLEIVRMLEGSCLNSAEPVRVLESSDAVSSESRGSSVPAGPFYFDQSTVPQVSQAAPAADQSTVPQVSQFDISADDDSGSWEHGVSVHELSTLKRLEPNKGFVYAVQTIQELPSADDALDVILDSGADMSCLPLEYAQHGFDHGPHNLQLRDAQGEPLAVNDLREVEFVVESSTGEHVVWREVCAIAPVTQPLLCKGKLMKAGWWPVRQPDMALEHDSGVRVPISFKGNSLCVRASIFRVGQESLSPAGHVMFVQASVCNEMADANFGWQMSGTGNLYFRGRSTHYIDPSIIAPVGWPCRTTLVKPCTPDHNAWILLEHCVHWGELRELAAILPHGESDVVCILSSSREELSEFGVEPHRSTQGHIDWSGPQPGDPDADELADYEPSEADMQDTSAPQLVEAMPGVPQVHRDVEVLPDAEGVTGEAPVPGSNSDILVFEGVELSLQSTLSVIRTACKSAGISVSGSKQRCLDRLRGYLDKQQLALSAEVAQTVGDDSTREPKGQSVTKAPTEAERQLHELTHWPFRPWCDHCMAMRGVEDRHESLPGSADTEVPIISFDYAFTSVSGAEGQGNAAKLTVLVAHDTSTGSVLGLPVASKGREDLKFSAIELTRFVQGLGHNSIFLCCDNEPSTLALQSLVVNVRTKLGFKTMIRDAPVHSHASKGYVEKAIDLVRGLSNVLLDQVRVKYNLSAETISADHPLMAWSYVHASYILNRFGVKGGATAFERATGYRFASKLACFGEPVWGFRRGKSKGDRKWHRAVFLSKTTTNNMYILMNAQGVWLTRSIRRNAKPWSDEVNLILEGKGFPWNYQLGVLGAKIFPQPRNRVPKPAEDADEVFEQQQSAQVDVSGARGDEAQAVASGMPSVAGMAGMPPLSSQPPNPAPSSRATLLLDRHDRGSASVPGSVPASVRPPPPAHAAVNESPMEVMGTDPPTSSDSSASSSPEALPTQPVFDDSTMLAEVVESVRAGASTGRQAEAEPDESHAAKFQRIARVGREDFPINDEVLESAAEWEDAAQYVQLGEDADAELDPSLTAEEAKLLEDEDLLWFEEIPGLSDEELSALDYVADTFEVKRLLGKQVLEEVGDSFDLSGYKELSTKFVRTWRQKKRHGRMMFFRRSRLVAREYKWMERDREGLYAPATSSLTTKLLPWLFCEMNRRQEGAATDDDPIGVVALDIKDAFLCVPQERPMLAKIPGFPKRMRFLKMLPGQRDGTARWHSFIMEYIREKHQLSVCAECPSLYKLKDAKDRSNPGVIHVDDLCLVGYVRWILQQLVPSLESTFELSYEDILVPDTSKLLDSAKAARFRSAIGIAMYVSQDRPDVAFTVRILSQKLREPTMQTWSSGQRLASYLACTTGYASKVHARGDKLSILEPSDPGGAHDGVLLEVFCDADWSGNKQNRRSMSSSSFFLNSCCVYTSCKSQRCVGLSSTESEFYALVSAACDGIYLKRVLEYLLELPVDLLMRTDNASCRQISLKQGVSKIRHLDGRFLWVQEKTADGTLKVGSVDGRWNPSDLGTKVPATGSRLRALLCMHDFVDCAGDCIQEVGRADYDQLVESLQHCKDTARVRRLINKSLKTNGLSNSNLVLMMVSLIAGADASGTRRDVSVQTEPEARWFSVWVTGLVILVSLLSVMLSLERLRADRRRDDASAYRTTSAEPSTSVPEYGRWSVITATLCGVPSLVCLMLMMQLRKLRFLFVTERHETDRLQGVINEMDYDRMMWAEHHAREGASASSSGVPLQVASHSGRVGDVPVHTPELHVYCTARRGKAYHAKRGCTCLNNADEILRLGLAEAKERGYQPCGRCFGGNRKQK
ncbi:unnamed protein product [Symbiodinium sp. CCMP2592]|nr:unnamed protein product [Symbiodinium sp. CCMP2592]